jgi:hypothetical protein
MLILTGQGSGMTGLMVGMWTKKRMLVPLIRREESFRQWTEAGTPVKCMISSSDSSLASPLPLCDHGHPVEFLESAILSVPSPINLPIMALKPRVAPSGPSSILS